MNTIVQSVDSLIGKKEVAEGKTTPETDESQYIRAITWQGKRSVACSMIPKPVLTHPDDVIVKVTACTICCGSDLHMYSGEVPDIPSGFVLGHEAVGIIESKGDNVKNFNIGDRVMVSCILSCGACDCCQRQEFSGCRQTNCSLLAEKAFGHAPAAVFGFSSLLGNVQGSQCEYVRVPIADVNCYKIPDSIPDRKALLVTDVLCTSLHAVDMANVKEGDTVVIWGLGPIGLSAARWCQLKRAKRIVGIDMVQERLQVACERLGIEVFDRNDYSSNEVVDNLIAMIPGGADCCIEAVGFRFDVSLLHKAQRAIGLETDTPEILTECFKVSRPYGIVSVIGDYTGFANQFPIGLIMMKHLTLVSGINPCQKYFQYILDKIESGEFDPSFLITHDIQLKDAPLAYRMLYNKEEGMIKVFMDPRVHA